MGDTTGIQWTDATWNPVTGCTKVSPGCLHCYAETLSKRFQQDGPHVPWTVRAQRAAGVSGVFLHHERLTAPLRWKKPRRIFVNSMSDLFHEAVPFEFIARVWDTMFNCGAVDQGPQHTFQILTKRPERMLSFVQWMNKTQNRETAYRNVWLGVSAENQRWADERLDDLARVPAPVRFVSYEPALGPMDLRRWLLPQNSSGNFFGYLVQQRLALQWVIVGGESGPKARPFDLAWARSVRDQCKAAGVPFFMKQLGRNPVTGPPMAPFGRIICGCGVANCPSLGGTGVPPHVEQWRPLNNMGGDPAEWPDDLRVREMPDA